MAARYDPAPDIVEMGGPVPAAGIPVSLRRRSGHTAAVLPPLVDGFELPQLVAAVRADGLPVELAGAIRRQGWENVVVETTDGWIVRFPRSEDAAFEREVAILARLDGRLPVPTPHVEYVGRRSRFAAYRRIGGMAYDERAYTGGTEADRDRLTGSLADLLAAMHGALSAGEVAALGIPGPAVGAVDGATLLRQVPAELRPGAEAILAEAHAAWHERPVPGPDLVLHNDFHFDNLTLDGPCGVVTGLWDFSCVQVGRPSFEVRYLVNETSDLLPRLCRHYRRRTGRDIDLRAARAAIGLEDLTDAVETADTDRLARLCGTS